MLVTESGIVTLVILSFSEKAKDSILVTGIPSKAEGTVTASPKPLYLLIVTSFPHIV